MNRSIMREKCMIIIYQITLFENLKLSYEKNDVIKDQFSHTNDFIDGILNGVSENFLLIDETANKYMDNWTIDRIDKPGAAILRIAFYELMFSDTPKIVVINEAVLLSKKYSDESVKKIINAALDKYVKEVK